MSKVTTETKESATAEITETTEATVKENENMKTGAESVNDTKGKETTTAIEAKEQAKAVLNIIMPSALEEISSSLEEINEMTDEQFFKVMAKVSAEDASKYEGIISLCKSCGIKSDEIIDKMLSSVKNNTRKDIMKSTFEEKFFKNTKSLSDDEICQVIDNLPDKVLKFKKGEKEGMISNEKTTRRLEKYASKVDAMSDKEFSDYIERLRENPRGLIESFFVLTRKPSKEDIARYARRISMEIEDYDRSSKIYHILKKGGISKKDMLRDKLSAMTDTQIVGMNSFDLANFYGECINDYGSENTRTVFNEIAYSLRLEGYTDAAAKLSSAQDYYCNLLASGEPCEKYSEMSEYSENFFNASEGERVINSSLNAFKNVIKNNPDKLTKLSGDIARKLSNLKQTYDILGKSSELKNELSKLMNYDPQNEERRKLIFYRINYKEKYLLDRAKLALLYASYNAGIINEKDFNISKSVIEITIINDKNRI